MTCTGCDTANNDWTSTSTDPINIYSVRVDLYLSKKVYFTTYYTLSAAKSNVNSHYLGDPIILTGANAFLLVGTNAAVPYPENVERSHEVGVIFKYKLTDRLSPRIEYRYQQWDNRDYQTTVMTPYMGCVSPAPSGRAGPRLHLSPFEQRRFAHAAPWCSQPVLPWLRGGRSLLCPVSFPGSGLAFVSRSYSDGYAGISLLGEQLL